MSIRATFHLGYLTVNVAEFIRSTTVIWEIA